MLCKCAHVLLIPMFHYYRPMFHCNIHHSCDFPSYNGYVSLFHMLNTFAAHCCQLCTPNFTHCTDILSRIFILKLFLRYYGLEMPGYLVPRQLLVDYVYYRSYSTGRYELIPDHATYPNHE